eukprot:755088-Hanusia_phi.AAC.1
MNEEMEVVCSAGSTTSDTNKRLDNDHGIEDDGTSDREERKVEKCLRRSEKKMMRKEMVEGWRR